MLRTPQRFMSLLVLGMLGCSEQLQVGEVEGVVLIDGKPARKIAVQFTPDVDQGARGPISTAETDENGAFTLSMFRNGQGEPGAMVGPHRVVLNDLQLAESATGAGVPVRLSAKYGLAGSTPLKETVKEGKQRIEIRVPPIR